MSEFIKDGGGSGRTAKVSSVQRLTVDSVQQSEATHSNKLGQAYNINTGNITLTSAADTPVLYIKNGESKDLIIEALAFGVKTSTGGTTTDLPEVTVIRNPTAGTTISNANAVAINSNRNYGSSNTLANSFAYKGATGETMTDGVDHLFIYLGTSGRSFVTINEVLPTGTTIGIKVKPQASNTSQVLYCAAICYLHED